MKIEQNISSNNVGSLLSRFLQRFHVVLYTVIAIGGLAVVVFMLYQTTLVALDVPDSDKDVTSSFDQATIDELESLSNKSSQAKPLDLPENVRINPFIY